MAAASAAVAGLPLLPSLLQSDRWLLWLGLLFIGSVYYFPQGIVGSLRGRAARPPATVSAPEPRRPAPGSSPR